MPRSDFGTSLAQVGSYFHFTPGFDEPEAFDISPHPGKTDPMYIVQARKSVSNL
jgi:hypothetical protein